MKVSIVIPNRNGAVLLQKNLPAVIVAARGAEVIVVDDASMDNSLFMLSTKFPSVRVVKKAHHDGFASTVNIGVKEASGDVVVLLNTDVRPQIDFLSPLVKHFSDPSVFAVGCLEKSVEGRTTVLRGRGEARWDKGFFIHWRGEVDKTTTAWISGGSGAFRKSMWEALGGMDTLYDPFYWEDIDLSFRAHKAGYNILFEPTSVVIHEHKQGIIKQDYSPFQIKTIAYRNQFLFIWKHIPDINIWLEHFFWSPVRLLQALFSGDFALLVGFGKAIVRRFFPSN